MISRDFSADRNGMTMRFLQKRKCVSWKFKTHRNILLLDTGRQTRLLAMKATSVAPINLHVTRSHLKEKKVKNCLVTVLKIYKFFSWWIQCWQNPQWGILSYTFTFSCRLKALRKVSKNEYCCKSSVQL